MIACNVSTHYRPFWKQYILIDYGHGLSHPLWQYQIIEWKWSIIHIGVNLIRPTSQCYNNQNNLYITYENTERQT